VGKISALRPDDSRAFLVGDVTPAAQLDRGRDVLLLRSAPERPVIGPAPASTAPTSPSSAAVPASTAAIPTRAQLKARAPAARTQPASTQSAPTRPAATQPAPTQPAPATTGARP